MFSHSVVSDSLWLYGLQPARLLCPWVFSRPDYWSGLPSSRETSQLWDQTQVSRIAGGLLIYSVQWLSRVWLFATPWIAAHQASLSSTTPRVTQNHVHWVGDAMQPSHPLLSPSPPAFNLSQHQGLFQCVSSSHQVAKDLEFQLQHQSFQWTLRTDFL